MEIRDFRPDDAPAVRALHEAALRPTGAWLDDPAWNADLDRVAEVYAAFWVATEAENVVGMVGMRRQTADTVELKRMRVAPDRQRQGIGTALARHALDWARRNGYREAVLDTTALQGAALALYGKLGFRETGRRIVRGLEIILMRLALRPDDDLRDTRPPST